MGAPLSGWVDGRRQAVWWSWMETADDACFFLLFFFLSSTAAAAAAPSRCGDHPTKSLRRIIQTQIKKNRATFRVTGRGGWWSSRHEGAGTLGLCAAGTRCVYTTQQLVAGLLWTRGASRPKKKQLKVPLASLSCVSLLCILKRSNPPLRKNSLYNKENQNVKMWSDLMRCDITINVTWHDKTWRNITRRNVNIM